jgi:hypothetical protein
MLPEEWPASLETWSRWQWVIMQLGVAAFWTKLVALRMRS